LIRDIYLYEFVELLVDSVGGEDDCNFLALLGEDLSFGRDILEDFAPVYVVHALFLAFQLKFNWEVRDVLDFERFLSVFFYQNSPHIQNTVIGLNMHFRSKN
jgi:hypothetical protein